MFDNRLRSCWLFCGCAIVGLAIAIYTSLPILDPAAPLFSNDEGLYLSRGAQGVMVLDLRYGLFSVLVRAYFLFTQNFFWVAVVHKTLLLAVFLLLQPALVRRHGIRVFTLLFFVFLFLNSHFLRDSLIFLFVLLAVSYLRSDHSIRRTPVLLPLLLTRPQALLLFLPPWLSALVVVCFVLFMRPLYAVEQLPENGMQTIFNSAFWEHVLHYGITTLANLNPLPTVLFFDGQGHYLQSILLVLASISMFAIFVQMALGLWSRHYRNAYMPRLWIGMVGLLVLYGSIGQPIDKRIFIALFTPFLIFVESSLLQWQNLMGLAAAWIAMLGIKAILA